MAAYNGSPGEDNFVATDAPDTFSFGENEGVDVIVGFDVGEDRLVYTDRSVDGFDDLEITRLIANGITSAVVESNDQIAVLWGVDPYALGDANFTFTTDGDRGDIEDARDDDDIDDVPDEVEPSEIIERARDLGADVGAGPDDGGRSKSAQIGDDRIITVRSVIDGQGDSEIVGEIRDDDGTLLRSFFVYEDSELNFDPVVAAIGDDRFAVAWTNQDDDDPEEAYVLVRTYSFEADALRSLALDGESYTTGEPAIAALDDGGFVVVFEDADGRIDAQRYAENGREVGDDFTIATDVSLAGNSPQVRAQGGGGYTVRYMDGAGLIQERSFDSDGTPAGSGPGDGVITGTEDDDVLRGTGGDDTIEAGDGDDVLRGRSGDDLLFGEDGDDKLIGGTGADTLVGGEGKDRYVGKGGADLFVIDDDSDRAIVADFEVGIDTLLLLDAEDADFAALAIGTRANGDAVVRYDDTRIILKGVEGGELSASDFEFSTSDDFLG